MYEMLFMNIVKRVKIRSYQRLTLGLAKCLVYFPAIYLYEVPQIVASFQYLALESYHRHLPRMVTNVEYVA